MKTVVVKFIADAADEWERLNDIVVKERSDGIENSVNQQLLKSIGQKTTLLKTNPQYGSPVPKRLIPKKFPVDNLWVVDLTGYWRMLYTLQGSEIEILCFILEVVDHRRYDRMFGYRKK